MKVPEPELQYGKLDKRIVFVDTDNRHAQLILRLKHDNLKQSNFFRLLITGYINGDERIQAFVDDHKKMSKIRKTKSKKLIEKGKQSVKDLNFSDDEITNIFDIIAEEHPEL